MRARYLPGDVVARRKGFVMHKGIALGGGRILHNTPFRGEHICTEDEFRGGHRLHVKRLSDEERRRVLSHADGWSPGRDYNLLSNNCEHTVTRAVHGMPHSPQLIGWAAGLVAGAAALALTRNAGAAAASYAVAKKLAQRAVKSLL
jgi:hypothetical protein